MARFFGNVGYGHTEETAPGVHKLIVTEKPYYGDVVRNPRRYEQGGQVNDNLTLNTSISIVADPYANEHFFAMRYVSWQGQLWIVRDVDASQPPRLLLRLGGVYNGPRPTA